MVKTINLLEKPLCELFPDYDDYTLIDKFAVKETPDELDKIYKLDKSYPVTDPWRLGWTRIRELEHGISTERNYLVVYTPIYPQNFDSMPALWIQQAKPFWKCLDDEWYILKRRIMGFSMIDAFYVLPDIMEVDLDDLYSRLTGQWID